MRMPNAVNVIGWNPELFRSPTLQLQELVKISSEACAGVLWKGLAQARLGKRPQNDARLTLAPAQS